MDSHVSIHIHTIWRKYMVGIAPNNEYSLTQARTVYVCVCVYVHRNTWLGKKLNGVEL